MIVTGEGARGPIAVEARTARTDVESLQEEFTRAARRSWGQLPNVDAAAAVEAGMLVHARAAAQPADHPIGEFSGPTDRGEAGDGPGAAVAAEVGAAASALQLRGVPLTAGPVDWNGFGTVVPVLAGSPGAGASVLAALLADAVQLEGGRVLVVDPADPPRSGLTMAARSEGPWLTRPHPHVHIRYSWRAQALLARLETSLPVVSPGMVPPPQFWRPPVGGLHATVVDLGHDPWRVAAHPLVGAGAWLRCGTPMPRPVLVVRPSRPSLLHAEQLLARLDAWTAPGAVAPPAQLVVMGAKRWPPGVAGAAGRRLLSLLAEAVFVPHHVGLAASGITASVTPARLRQAITPVLHRWGLLPASAAITSRSSAKGRNR